MAGEQRAKGSAEWLRMLEGLLLLKGLRGRVGEGVKMRKWEDERE